MRRRKPAGIFLALALTASAFASLTPAHARPGTTHLLSLTGSGGVTNGHTPARSVPDTTSPSLSLDGLSVAFSSDATNIVSGDTNNAADIFVRHIPTETVTRVSTNKKGGQANGASYSPVLSVDGKKIAFISRASNLVSGDTNGKADVFFKNLVTGYIYRVSESSSGVQANGDSFHPFISLFGDWVTFESAATNLSGGDTNGMPDAFVHTRQGRKLRRLVSPDAADNCNTDCVSKTASATISYDGKTLAFERTVVRTDPELPPESNICVETPSAPADASPPKGHDVCPMGTPIASDVFVEVKGKKVRRIVMSLWGSSRGAAKKMLGSPVVTADGRYVSYEAWSAITSADTLGLRPSFPREAPGGPEVAAETQWIYDYLNEFEQVHTIEKLEDHSALARNPYDQRTVYMYDHKSKVHFPVSTNLAGPYSNGDCYNASPNAYGTIIAFTCDATNMVPGDTNDTPDVFVKDLPGRATSRVSLSTFHSEGFGRSVRPSISYDGRYVAFASNVQSFVNEDKNGLDDVFMRDRMINTVNVPPKLSAPIKEPIAVDMLEQVEFQLSAKDGNNSDKGTLRFGAIAGLPSGAHIDPVSGVFSWLPGPENTEPGGKRHDIVFWVGDPRGTYSMDSLALVTIFVRDSVGTIRCEMLGSACDPPK